MHDGEPIQFLTRFQNLLEGFGIKHEVVKLLFLFVFKQLEVNLLPVDEFQASLRNLAFQGCAGFVVLNACLGAASDNGNLLRSVGDIGVAIGLEWNAFAFGTLFVVVDSRQIEAARKEVFVALDWDYQLDRGFGWNAFAGEVFVELCHEIGAHGEDVERL